MIKSRARSMKAVAVVAVGFLIAGVSVTAASAITSTQFVTVIWNMSPTGNMFVPAQTLLDYKVTASPELGAFDHLLVGKCVGFQVDVYKYTEAGDKTAVDNLIAGGVLYAPNTPTEPLIPGVAGTAWKTHRNSECEVPIPPTVTTTDDCGLDNATLVGDPQDGVVWSEVTKAADGTLSITASPAPFHSFPDSFQRTFTHKDSGEICIIPVDVQPTVTTTDDCGLDNATLAGNTQDGVVWSEVTKADDGTLSITASPAKGRSFPDSFQTVFTYKDSGELCPIGVSVEVTVVDPPVCGPDNDVLNIPEGTEGVRFEDTNWVDGERTIKAFAEEGYVLEGESSWTFYDVATACPATTVAPTVVAICLPNNDTVTIPEVDGVIYTDNGWVGGERTITAAAAEGYALTEGSATSWTFTDTPSAACPDEIGFSYTPTGELAYTGASTSTNGLTGLAIFLMAAGTALVALRTRAAR